MQDLYDSGHYEQWRNDRLQDILAHYGPDFFKGKTFLEVACAWGHNGKFFSDLGADVTCTDHYDKWVNIVKERYPHIKSQVQNLLDPWPFTEKFDVILNMGVLYHVPHDRVEQVIRDTCNNATHVIFETAVAEESNDPYYVRPAPKPPVEDLWEEIATEYCYPSQQFVSRVISECGMNVVAKPSHPGRYLWFGSKI